VWDTRKRTSSFWSGAAGAPGGVGRVEGITGFASALRIRVIAEGIESQEQWDRLAATDCQYGQGFLFGRPMAGASVRSLLRTHPEPRLPFRL